MRSKRGQSRNPASTLSPAGSCSLRTHWQTLCCAARAALQAALAQHSQGHRRNPARPTFRAPLALAQGANHHAAQARWVQVCSRGPGLAEAAGRTGCRGSGRFRCIAAATLRRACTELTVRSFHRRCCLASSRAAWQYT